MMKEGDVHKLWPGLHLHMRFVICFCILLCSSSYHSMSSFRGVSILSHLSWVPDFRDRLPWFAMPLWPIARRWSAARLQQPAKAKDIWYHLVSQLINKSTAWGLLLTSVFQMDEAGMEKVKPSLAEVGADAVLTIIAGADTTSCAMTSLLWLLLSNQECYERLQKEIDTAYPPGSDPLDVSKHSNLPYLAACMFVDLNFKPN